MRYQIRLFFFNIGVIDFIFKQNEMKKMYKIKNRKKLQNIMSKQNQTILQILLSGSPGVLGFFAKVVDSLFQNTIAFDNFPHAMHVFYYSYLINRQFIKFVIVIT